MNGTRTLFKALIHGGACSRRIVFWSAAVLACASMQAQQNPAAAPDNEKAAAEQLAKAAQNPVASLISVPVQNTSNFNVGDFNRTSDSLNVQPVLPAKLNENWNLVTRIIQPFVWQPYPNQNAGGQYGLGDMNPSFFLSPGKPGKIIWGAGPAFVIPTATSSVLGQGKFSLGPTIVALAQPGKWTIGALSSNVWSVAGSKDRPAVNQMVLQYFVNYNLKNHWYITISPVLTANWRASSGNIWTVPFGGGLGKITKLGGQPINVSAQFYYNAVRPDHAPSWGMRLQIAFLYPKLTRQQQKMMLEKKLKQMEEQPPKKS